MKNIRANATANMLVRILNIVFPLITTAYLSRVLSKPLYGDLNVANVYLSLFVPFATLGVYSYGIREISKVKSNIDDVNKVFSSLFYVSIVSTIITTVFFIVIKPIYTESPSIQLLISILGIQLLAQVFNIEWMNEAFENYSFLFYKTLIIRICMLVSIFVFVRESEDIIPYAYILSLSQLANYLLSFIWIKREVRFVRVPFSEYKKLIKPLFALFLLANANMLYTTLDQTFISMVGAPEQVAYYANALRIVFVLSGVVSGAISVSVPRLGYYVGLGDDEAYRNLVLKSSRLFAFFICPLSLGMCVLGTEGTVLMYGTKYLAGGIVTSIFAIRILSWAVEIILGTQIILVNGYENKLTQLYFIGGAVNLALNGVLYAFGISDPKYYVVTTIISEYVLLFFEYKFISGLNIVDPNKIILYFVRYTLIALGFVPITMILSYLYPIEMIINTRFMIYFLMVFVACVIYYILALVALKDQTFFQVLNELMSKLKKAK